jgi:predicted N-formylglutamate amidohydrolase
MGLLRDGEPAPVTVLNESGRSRLFLTADHAGRRIPAALGDLGVSAPDLDRHIAWDIGIEAVTRRLSAALDAVAVLQVYSRLVIDCNRQPAVPSAFPEVSEATAIPGNVRLPAAEKLARQAAIFDPYHQEIARLLAARAAVRPIYVAMHSFTPVYLGQARDIELAVLYNRNPRGGHALAAILREEAGLVVAENAPYRVSDETDYGVPVHAERSGLDYIEIEIRQDLIGHEAGQIAWAERLAVALPKVIQRLEGSGG